ncbi:T9SS type A sorting domain-containing protein [Hymenobacter metallicola]|uniref:T9SS type A sorting domain-containing protein n=1 Tax=Hymenobacter metallicola TaxID=2563114 RepID=A0A4Z0PUY3_9BACT|nr:T9SS type A sorting domain-containing protein [Hymenobacter metallicola]TGE21074.1 T9SS type A sorting domain-containing protein [Hymenobacter metallicola]
MRLTLPFYCAALLLQGLYLPAGLAQTKLRDYAFGGSGSDFSTAALPTSNGGLLLAGSTFSPAGGDVSQPRFSSGIEADFWLVQTDAQGNKQWDKRFGGTGDDRLLTMLPTADGGYLLCGSSTSGASYDHTAPSRGANDYWVVKIDSRGTKLWDKSYGTSGGDMLTTAVAAPDGGFLLVGWTSSPDDPAPNGDRTEPLLGDSDAWLVKIDAAGTKQWDKRLGGLGYDYVYDAVSTSGGFLIGALPFVPGGDVSGVTHGGNDFWVAKVSDQGAKVWDRLYGGSGNDDLRTMLATPDGGVLVGGYSSSPVSGDKSVAAPAKTSWLLKLDAQGTKQWDNVYNTGTAWTEDDYLSTLALNPLGGYLLAGITAAGPTYGTADTDIWMAAIGMGGDLSWSRVYSGLDHDSPASIVPAPNGSVRLACSTPSGIGRDKTVSSRGGNDFWVLEIGSPALGVRPTQQASFSAALFPNPASATDYVTLEVTGLPDSTPVQVTVLNSVGQVLQTLTLTERPTGRRPLDVSRLPAGVYTVRLQTAQGTVNTQLLKH